MVELKLDTIELVYRAQAQPTDPITELREVHDIHTVGHRNVVEVRIPGADGNVLQDMGREPVRILFTGQIWGPDAKTTVQKLLDKYNARKSLPFSSDITTLADVSDVVIENLVFEAAAGKANYYTYQIALVEYKEPKPSQQQAPPPQQANQNQSEIDDIRGRILDADGNPAKGVAVKIKGPEGEKQVKTDSQGYYEVLDVPEGSYEITTDAEGYEDQKAEAEIKKGTDGGTAAGNTGAGGAESESGAGSSGESTGGDSGSDSSSGGSGTES